MTKGCKVWLWLVLVLNAISLVGSVVSLSIMAIIASAAIVAGAVFLLFQQKKMGLYIIIGGCVVSLIGNIIAGTNIFIAIIAAVIMPLITYFLVSKNNDVFK